MQQYKEDKEDRERSAARQAQEFNRDYRAGLTPGYIQSLALKIRTLEYKLDLILEKLEEPK